MLIKVQSCAFQFHRIRSIANKPGMTTAISGPGLSEPWIIAKDRFLDILDDREKVLFNEATLENLYYSASNLERKDRQNSKTRAVVRKLRPLVLAIENYGKAFDTYANIAPLYLAPIWGSIRIILVVAQSHSRFYDVAVDTFSRIGDLLPRLRG
jgi:hypothetical protein